MSEYMDYNEWLKIEVERLNDENTNIKHFFSYDELDFLNEITEIKEENKLIKQQIDDLISENYELQNELITQQMNGYDNNEHINKLKQELFNTYLFQQHQERLISELKIALSSYNNFVDVMFPD